MTDILLVDILYFPCFGFLELFLFTITSNAGMENPQISLYSYLLVLETILQKKFLKNDWILIGLDIVFLFFTALDNCKTSAYCLSILVWECENASRESRSKYRTKNIHTLLFFSLSSMSPYCLSGLPRPTNIFS